MTTVLIEPSSFAIWNRNKVIVGIATGVWVVNFALMLSGEFSPLSLTYYECHRTRLISGVVQVNNRFKLATAFLSYPTVDSRCMVACDKGLRIYQH